MKRFLIALTCLLALSGTACTSSPELGESSGMVRWIEVPEGRLKTKIYGLGKLSENPVLIVFLHGDGRGPSYQYAIAQVIAEGFDRPEVPKELKKFLSDDVVAAGLLRPGYTDKAGDRSDGRQGQRNGDNHTREVTHAVNEAVTKLKKELNARAVILIGHSGGATISANLLALYPDTADAALLVACGCDMKAVRARYYERTGKKIWREPVNSLDPLMTVDGVPSDKKVRLLVGAHDVITSPIDMRLYSAALAARGVDVNVEVASDHDHNSLVFAPAMFRNLDKLVKVY